MGNARQRTPASATQSRQNVKRRAVELPAESTMVVPKRRRMEGSSTADLGGGKFSGTAT
jgi:hypothetical protein